MVCRRWIAAPTMAEVSSQGLPSGTLVEREYCGSLRNGLVRMLDTRSCTNDALLEIVGPEPVAASRSCRSSSVSGRAAAQRSLIAVMRSLDPTACQRPVFANAAIGVVCRERRRSVFSRHSHPWQQRNALSELPPWSKTLEALKETPFSLPPPAHTRSPAHCDWGSLHPRPPPHPNRAARFSSRALMPSVLSA